MAEEDLPTWDDSIPTWDDSEPAAEDVPTWDDSEPPIRMDPDAVPLGGPDLSKFLDDPAASLAGAVHTLTFKNADEISGALSGAMSFLQGDGYLDAYRDRRDEVRAYLENKQKTSPEAFGIGEAGGAAVGMGAAGLASKGKGVASKAVSAVTDPGSLLTRALPTLQKYRPVEGAVSGLVSGTVGAGMMGIGDSESPDIMQNLSDGYEAAKMGAVFGGGLGGVTGTLTSETAGRVGSYLPKKSADLFDSLAEKFATKAAIGNQVRLNEPLVRQGKVNEFGRKLLDDGIVSTRGVGVDHPMNPIRVGNNAPEILANARNAKKNSWDGMDTVAVLSDIDVNASGLASKIRTYADEFDLPDPGAQATRQKLNSIADAYEEYGDVRMEDAQAWKNYYTWDDRDPNKLSVPKEIANKMQLLIGDAMEEAALKHPKSDLISKYQTFKEGYGTAAKAEQGAIGGTSQMQKNRLFSLTDYMSGGVGAMSSSGDPTEAAALGLMFAGANKFARERGPATVATYSNSLASLLRKAPQVFGKFSDGLLGAVGRGESYLSAYHYVKSKNDPEYRQAVEEAIKQSEKFSDDSLAPSFSPQP